MKNVYVHNELLFEADYGQVVNCVLYQNVLTSLRKWLTSVELQKRGDSVFRVDMK